MDLDGVGRSHKITRESGVLNSIIHYDFSRVWNFKKSVEIKKKTKIRFAEIIQPQSLQSPVQHLFLTNVVLGAHVAT